jgi:hypothetical protein
VQVKRVYDELLETRGERWAQFRAAVMDTLSELSQFYTGGSILVQRHVDEGLSQWLAHFADQV